MSPPRPATAPTAAFTSGSTLGHVVRMTAAASVGLAALFAVDVLNLFYIARLGQPSLTAAAGYAGTLLFFIVSLSIGLSIAATALTARALGAGDRDHARQLAGASLVIMAAAMALAAAVVAPLAGRLLGWLGATGETAAHAHRFLLILLPSLPLLGLGMCLGALLRAVGDARRAMWVTLGASGVAAVVDPLFILGLGWGLDGAAWATYLTRGAMVWIGWRALRHAHDLFRWPDRTLLLATLRPYLAIGVPAVLTQIATPVGNALVTHAMAAHGDAAVAAWAVIVRLIPVSFVVLFALSGSIGPIIGQNLGARRYDRLHSTLRDSLLVVLLYVMAVWALLAVGSGAIASAFDAHGQARELIVFFCLFVAGSFLFNGALFVANAAFNNLGFAFYSTALNWGRATLGVAPFIAVGSQLAGATGVLAGYGLGVVLFGAVGAWLAFRVVGRLAREGASAVS